LAAPGDRRARSDFRSDEKQPIGERPLGAGKYPYRGRVAFGDVREFVAVGRIGRRTLHQSPHRG
jgi:hypothetical protein